MKNKSDWLKLLDAIKPKTATSDFQNNNELLSEFIILGFVGLCLKK